MPKPRKSTKVLKLQGTYQKCRHDGRNAPQPEPVKRCPVPPSWLSPDQKKIFKRMAKQLIEVDVLSSLDTDMLAVYSALYHKVSTDFSGANSAMMGQLRSLANDLGLTPAARERLTVKKPETETNDFDDI